MDRFTRWTGNKPFEDFTGRAANCPPRLRPAAAWIAGVMAAEWADLAKQLEATAPIREAK